MNSFIGTGVALITPFKEDLSVDVQALENLVENDYNLNIPLYVEKIIEDNLPSVEEAMAELMTE